MKKPDLANLYQHHSRRNRGVESLPKVEALVALAEGDGGAEAERLLADVGRFGLHADLLRLARDLAPESARLGVALERTCEAANPVHRGRGRERFAARRPWLRIAASLAAGLVVAVAVWVARHDATPAVAPAVAEAPHGDRIFAAFDERTEPARPDVIFRTEFASDRIFSSKFSGG
jgi:hypothetical protein